MLKWRLTAAACILLPLCLLIWLDDQHHGGRPGVWLAPVAILVSGLAAGELNRLLQAVQLPVSSLANLAATLAVTAGSAVPIFFPATAAQDLNGRLAWSLVGLAAGVALLLSAELVRYREPGESIRRLAGGMLCLGYVGFLMGMLIQLRVALPGRAGLVVLLATLLIVKLADTGAYFTGRMLGRTKFTRVSPGKTVEGCLGGLLFALAAAALTQSVLLPRLVPQHPAGSLANYLALGGCLMVAGLGGDLAESLLKRDAGVKDSSSWLPGLGGVLDIVDSLLVTAPISLLWVALGKM